MSTGTLYVIATPIGNLGDISFRAVKLLCSIPVIAAEDTRRTGMLIGQLRELYAHKLDIPPDNKQRFVSYRDQNELSKAAELLSLLEQGIDVALVSDAGTPLLSDPGHIIVKEARKNDVSVMPIPGSSSVIAALSVSGLPASTFSFFGYPPSKQGKRIALFQSLLTHHTAGMTLVFLLAPHDVTRVLDDIRSVYGDISVVIMREMTKTHESRHEGFISKLLEDDQLTRGESVLLFTNQPAS